LEFSSIQLEGVSMSRFFWALLIGCGLTIVPIVVLKLPTDSGIVGSLKWGVTNLMVPGGFVGLIASGGRIDDVNPWLSGFANSLFYFGLAYLSLTVWRRLKSKSGGGARISTRRVAKP
jgi:hypothetical protein